MSRSTRRRKPVNYRKLLDESDGSDDDFESGPPSKKARPAGDKSSESVKNGGKDAQMKSVTSQKEAKKPARLSRDERQFTRQLEQALAASKNNSNNNVSVSDEVGDTEGAKASENTSTTVCTTQASSKDNDFVPDQSVSSDESGDESFSAVEEEDDKDSDFSASPQPKKAKKKQTKENAKSASKGKQAKAKKPTADSVINSDKSRTNSLVKKATRSTAVKITPVKPLVQETTQSVSVSLCAAKPTATNRVKSSLASIKSCKGNSSAMGVNKRAVNWTPPAKVGEGNMPKTDSLISKSSCVCSGGGTPVIRVGLSRNARVKSLHTNVKT